jgi:putative peptidoglycan lipid II flippase
VGAEVNPTASGPAHPGGGERLARAAGLISGLTLVSRILGLAREQVFAALLGAGLYADAFQIGFRIPNLLRDLFAEGALSSAFVPTYARTVAAGGREAGHRLGSRVLTLLAVVLGAVVVLGILFAPAVVATIAPGYAAIEGKGPFTILLTRVMMPFLPLVSFAAVAMGMLNAEERYAAPAIAPAMFNVVAILWGALLWSLGYPPREVALGWALGTLLSGTAQFLVQVPPLWRTGWRFRWDWAPGDPEIRRIVRLMGPSIVGLAAVQLNIFLNSIFASHQPGAVSWLNYAFRILYLPIGLFGVAVGTIATSGLARRAAAGDMDGLRATLREALALLLFLTVPSTLGLVVLGEPVVRLLYEHGRFTAADTTSTATALAYYGVGLVAYTGVKVLAPAFYALGSARVPLFGTILAVLTNVTVMVFGFPVLSYRAVALGTGLGSLVNATVLFVVFERRVGGLRGSGLAGRLLRIVGAALAMAAVVAWAAAELTRVFGTKGFAAHAAVGLVPVVVGVLVYQALALLLGIPEARTLLRLFRRRP